LTAKPLEPIAGDNELEKAMKARYNSALKSLQGSYFRATLDPNSRLTTVVAAARTLLDAELAITAPKETAAVYQRYLEFWKYMDSLTERRWNQKTIGADEFNAVREARLDAEIKRIHSKEELQTSAERVKSRIRALEANVQIAAAEADAAQAGVIQAEADLRRAQVNFKFHDGNWQRLQILQKQAAVSIQDIAEARRDRDLDEANIDGAKAAIVAARAQATIKKAQLQKAEAELSDGKANLER
jgi:hypothetical protein